SKADQATKAKTYAEENKALWTNETFAPDITSIISRATTSLASIKDQNELRSTLEGVEAKLKDSSQTAESLSAVRRSLNDIEPKAASAGPEFVQRVKQAFVDFTQA